MDFILVELVRWLRTVGRPEDDIQHYVKRWREFPIHDRVLCPKCYLTPIEHRRTIFIGTRPRARFPLCITDIVELLSGQYDANVLSACVMLMFKKGGYMKRVAGSIWASALIVLLQLAGCGEKTMERPGGVGSPASTSGNPEVSPNPPQSAGRDVEDKVQAPVAPDSPAGGSSGFKGNIPAPDSSGGPSSNPPDPAN